MTTTSKTRLDLPKPLTEYYLFNGLGSVVQMTDESGFLTAEYSYEPFGGTRNGVKDPFNRHRFVGLASDDTTGLIYMNARWYDPQTGRFISRDPVFGSLTNPQTLNPYAYAGNNPINITDITGESWLGDAWSAVKWWAKGSPDVYYENGEPSKNQQAAKTSEDSGAGQSVEDSKMNSGDGINVVMPKAEPVTPPTQEKSLGEENHPPLTAVDLAANKIFEDCMASVLTLGLVKHRLGEEAIPIGIAILGGATGAISRPISGLPPLSQIDPFAPMSRIMKWARGGATVGAIMAPWLMAGYTSWEILDCMHKQWEYLEIYK